MESCFLPFRSSLIHYFKAGKGEKLLICLHGYGETAAAFSFVASRIGDAYTLLAIDLPFHGKTAWNEQESFTGEDLEEIVSKMQKAVLGKEDGIVLLGSSMGGRVALCLLQSMPQKIQKAIILSPDGIRISTWYSFATGTWLGSGIFRYTLSRPGWLFFLLKMTKKFRWADETTLAFVNHYVQDEKTRTELFKRWMALRKCCPNPAKIRSAVSANHISLQLVYGSQDRIARYEIGEKFRLGIETHCRVILHACGHRILQEKNADLILGLIVQ